MAKKPKSLLWRAGVLLVACVVAWMQYQENTASAENGSKNAHKERGGGSSKSSKSPKKKSSGEYEVLERCSLIPHKHNDGDSFHVRTPKGEDVEFRLYFVDTPESRPKTYGHGANNFKRIAEQGAYFGGLNQKQTTQIGAEGKHFVKSLLSQQKFRVTTRWESVYSSARRYAFVTVQWQGKSRYLHEVLVSKGYARIHTLGRALPDGGRSYYRQKSHLKELERAAKKDHRGAWGL